MRYLLDSNICIYAMSGRHPQVLHRMQKAGKQALYVDAIVVSELAFGVAKSASSFQSRNKLQLQKFLLVLGQHQKQLEAQMMDLQANLDELKVHQRETRSLLHKSKNKLLRSN